ncbi:uncharacterized protein [Arachis hypogaea]|uniref:uncharacterized protein n=1 Tax=Arachis hypogaea TaxID=3818 RepID=UPI000DED2B3D|nr:uncharacterized protein LOC112742976 [Arachis hypogaea]
MDAYSGYNQILMHPSNQDKTAFITDFGNYCYKVMPFGLKNAGATYQRLMDKVFAKQIGRNIEVYVDDMVAKTKIGHNHISDLTEIFGQIRQYNMRLNPEKCAFAVQGEIAGRLRKWAVELSEFDIRYQSRGPIKSQFLADFIAEFTTPSEEDHAKQWILYVDGSSNNGGCGAGIRLEAEDGFILEHSIHLAFKASNNQSEYEALLAGLRLCLDLQISTIKNLKINQHFASVEHPQTNGLAEAANKVILHALKKKLDDAKGLWAELIPEVLWGYNTTPQTSTKETPFRLVYGSEAMIPLEISQNSIRTYIDNQDEARRSELDIIEEIRDIAALKQRAVQQAIARQYNKSVKSRSFVKGDLVLRKTETARKPPTHGKLAANWDGPYRVSNVLGQGAYKLESLDGKLMPSTWNVSSLKKFYS